MKDLDVRLAAPIQKDSIVDGEGLRTVIWLQGCPHHCKGCHNPESWAYDKGDLVKLESIIDTLKNLTNQTGITISGGEPFAQLEALLDIVLTAKEQKLSIWVYTGFLFEDLLEYGKSNPIYEKILTNINVLVEGPFIESEKSLNLWFKGSRNQRVLDMKKSMKNKIPVLIPKYKKEKKVTKLSTRVW